MRNRKAQRKRPPPSTAVRGLRADEKKIRVFGVRTEVSADGIAQWVRGCKRNDFLLDIYTLVV